MRSGNRFNRWSRRRLWEKILTALIEVDAAPEGLAIDSTHVKAHRSVSGGKGGEIRQAVGRLRGRRTTKIHALTDTFGRPYALLLTPGNVADILVAPALIAAIPPSARLIGDKGYDANSLRRMLADRGTSAVIPSTVSRKKTYPLDRRTCRDRNVIERICCRLKDFRRIATRYEKLARNFLSALALVAAIIWWTD